MIKLHEDHNGVCVYSMEGEEDCFIGHDYCITSEDVGDKEPGAIGHDVGVFAVIFQNGPVKEVGINGITNEALLMILMHRTAYLNSCFPCRENEVAISAMATALAAFESRTKGRIERGVEGENKA